VNRRELLILGAGTAIAWPLAARAQQEVMPIVGYLSSQPPTSGVGADTAAGWREGLAESGFVEGRNVEIIYRWAGGDYDRLPALAAELVGRNVSVIYASSLPAALAAKSATATIPIFFGVSVDPVAFGLVASLSRPGGNLTGITNMFDQIEEKRLQPTCRGRGTSARPPTEHTVGQQRRRDRCCLCSGAPKGVKRPLHRP
jgi:putative ABC transport system substrate-binding protein